MRRLAVGAVTGESLLSYKGPNGMDGLAHVRVYEAPGRLPVVIAGQLDDNPGIRLSLAIEMVAAAIQSSVLPTGVSFACCSLSRPTCSATPGLWRSASPTGAPARIPGDPPHYSGQTIVIAPTGEARAVQCGAAKEVGGLPRSGVDGG